MTEQELHALCRQHRVSLRVAWRRDTAHTYYYLQKRYGKKVPEYYLCATRKLDSLPVERFYQSVYRLAAKGQNSTTPQD